ncbi:hypothetical protein CIB48_g3682 [Xylaria polymorpha]|nr:hypothetical protein CIB48_g3682 [Xylaria polymorpha]
MMPVCSYLGSSNGVDGVAGVDGVNGCRAIADPPRRTRWRWDVAPMEDGSRACLSTYWPASASKILGRCIWTSKISCCLEKAFSFQCQDWPDQEVPPAKEAGMLVIIYGYVVTVYGYVVTAGFELQVYNYDYEVLQLRYEGHSTRESP